ncbi:MAG: 5-(carboxyamino)imidazole ribonucleotide synthase [Candidatus Omnitrophica bacterium]|nr:5-(carboxyamino)imidazole ribonucleotide synthase [Candidatus Omnitrophota bacterium]
METFFGKEIRLGILRGGQLGRMLLQPCMNFGIIPHIMDIDESAPARPYCHQFSCGDAGNYDDVYRFGKGLDALTLEIEHVNLDALQQLQHDGVNVFPDPSLIEIVQDKGLQKQFYRDRGLPTADFFLVDSLKEWMQTDIAFPVVQKARREGYDGRGVAILNDPQDLGRAIDSPSVIETRVDIKKEISVLVARNQAGQVSTFPTVEMVFHEGVQMLDYLFAPARIPADQDREAVALAERLAREVGLVGLLAVEMFVTADDRILINEIAPRPHNSGHHTIEACRTSQFEQHIRSIFNLPLGSTELIAPAVMVNIVGEPGHSGPVAYIGIEPFLELPGVYIHRYGKKITRPHRKMGHVTVVRDSLDEALEIAQHIKEEVKAISCQSQS